MITTRRVVRRLGTSTTHVVDVPDTLLGTAHAFGVPFTSVTTPVAAACGATLRDSSGVVSCMNPDTTVTCRPCRHITGLEVAADGNTKLPEPSTP
jgi:hypothetical protein